MSLPSRCAAVGCNASIPRRMLMCRRHWRMVPLSMRLNVLAAYRTGQEDGSVRLGREWLAAAREAIDAVARAEGRTRRDAAIGQLTLDRALGEDDPNAR